MSLNRAFVLPVIVRSPQWEVVKANQFLVGGGAGRRSSSGWNVLQTVVKFGNVRSGATADRDNTKPNF